MSENVDNGTYNIARKINFETVPGFVYLSSSLNSRNVIRHEIDNRISAENKAKTISLHVFERKKKN